MISEDTIIYRLEKLDEQISLMMKKLDVCIILQTQMEGTVITMNKIEKTIAALELKVESLESYKYKTLGFCSAATLIIGLALKLWNIGG